MHVRRLAAVLLTSLAAMLVAVPAASASRPGDTEHGVNRAKLASKAQLMVEARNGIEVLKISKCGPQKRKRKVNYSTWICLWRAEGVYPGEVPYHCSGKAVYKRKRKRWRVERCENRLQPMAPLLATPNPPATFGFNEDWIFQPVPSLDLLERSGAQVARTSIPWAGVEPTRGSFNWHGSDVLYERLRERGIRPLWVLIGAPCFAQQNPGACASGNNQLHPDPDYYDEFADFAVSVAKRYPESAGFEVWNEPNYPKYWGGPPEPAELRADAEDGCRHPAQPGPGDAGGQRRALAPRRQRHQRLDRVPRLPDRDVRARRGAEGRRDRNPSLSGRRAGPRTTSATCASTWARSRT